MPLAAVDPLLATVGTQVLSRCLQNFTRSHGDAAAFYDNTVDTLYTSMFAQTVTHHGSSAHAPKT